MSRMVRTEAMPIGEVLKLMLKDARISSSHNTRRIFDAWDEASGAARYTMRKYFREGRLYITVNSSVIRSQLGFQKDLLVEKVNAILAEDPLFISDDRNVSLVKELILK